MSVPTGKRERWTTAAGALCFAAALTWAFTESACPSYQGASKLHRTRIYLRFIESQIEQKRAETGRVPDDLPSLVDGRGRYQPRDAWDRDLIYQKVGPGYRVYSAGRNAADEAGGGDDVFSNASPKQYTCEQYEEECVTACRVTKWISLAVAILAGFAFSLSGAVRRLNSRR